MTTNTYTHEQIRAEFEAAKTRLKPAVLKESPEDQAFIERLVSQYILANQLEPTADNFYAAFKFHFKVLPWLVKPAKLLLLESESKTTIIPTVPELGNDFEARVRAGEKKNEKKVADIKTFQRIDEAISTLSLHFKSDTASQQTRLRGYVATEKARNAEPESIFHQVKNEIERLYHEEERARMYL